MHQVYGVKNWISPRPSPFLLLSDGRTSQKSRTLPPYAITYLHRSTLHDKTKYLSDWSICNVGLLGTRSIDGAIFYFPTNGSGMSHFSGLFCHFVPRAAGWEGAGFEQTEREKERRAISTTVSPSEELLGTGLRSVRRDSGAAAARITLPF